MLLREKYFAEVSTRTPVGRPIAGRCPVAEVAASHVNCLVHRRCAKRQREEEMLGKTQMGKKLTEQQIEDYKRDGFLFPVDIFSEAEAARLRAALEQAEAKWPEAFVGAARNNAHYNFTVLDEIVHSNDLLDAVEDLIGPDILNSGTVLFIKEARDPGFVSWHQDARYMGLEPHVGVTAWLALSPSIAESGCMRMIPGSHRDELHEHIDTFGVRTF